MNTFKAFGKTGTACGATAKEAALNYFEKFPTSRKCDVSEGVQYGPFFTLALRIGGKSTSLYGITKKQALLME